jgi:RNA polymerase sigma-70 factor (ECF subfamily)
VSDDLDALLPELVEMAARAWPAFRVPPEAFFAYLRERLPADVPAPVAVREMHTTDLYLACACSRGEPEAVAAFEEHCLRPLDRVLGKMRIGADASADVKQDVRVRVLVGNGRPPAIADFTGRGDLRGWVRVIAVRHALRRVSRARRDTPCDDDELLQIILPGDPGLDGAKQAYRQEFKQAFESALRALPDRERTLLRQHHVDGLTIDELGALYRVHRATAARLLARARMFVVEETRARMMSRLQVPSQDLDSILRMIQSQIDISLRGLQRGRRR